MKQQPLRVDAGLLVLRLALGTIVLFHGVFKATHGVGWIGDLLRSHGLPGVLANGVYVAEVIAPVFLFVGAYTRLAAIVIAFDMFMAIALAQHQGLFSVNQGGGWGVEVEAMIFCMGVALGLTGGGRYAVDAYRARAAAVGGR